MLRLQFSKQARLMMRLQRRDCVIENDQKMSSEEEKVDNAALVQKIKNQANTEDQVWKKHERKLFVGLSQYNWDIQPHSIDLSENYS